MKEIVLVVLEKDKDALGDVRCFPGLRVAVAGDRIWIRGIPASENIDLKIRQLPAVITYFLDHDDRLFPCDRVTPTEKLPQAIWIPLQEFITVHLPVSNMPGEINQKAYARLATSGNLQTGNALLTTLTQWKKFAETAAEIRLEKIRFAVSENDDVLLLGNPLPPVSGKEYYLRDLNLLPCGYDFDPQVISSLLSKKLNPYQDALLLFAPDGSWEKIPVKNFMTGKRSAVRLTNSLR